MSGIRRPGAGPWARVGVVSPRDTTRLFATNTKEYVVIQTVIIREIQVLKGIDSRKQTGL